MHNAMEQIAIYNVHVRHFEIFLDIFLRPGLRADVTALIL